MDTKLHNKVPWLIAYNSTINHAHYFHPTTIFCTPKGVRSEFHCKTQQGFTRYKQVITAGKNTVIISLSYTTHVAPNCCKLSKTQ